MRTVHETIAAIRAAVNTTDGSRTGIHEDEIVALCDRIEQLERDIELAKQDWGE